MNDTPLFRSDYVMQCRENKVKVSREFSSYKEYESKFNPRMFLQCRDIRLPGVWNEENEIPELRKIEYNKIVSAVLFIPSALTVETARKFLCDITLLDAYNIVACAVNIALHYDSPLSVVTSIFSISSSYHKMTLYAECYLDFIEGEDNDLFSKMDLKTSVIAFGLLLGFPLNAVISLLNYLTSCLCHCWLGDDGNVKNLRLTINVLTRTSRMRFVTLVLSVVNCSIDPSVLSILLMLGQFLMYLGTFVMYKRFVWLCLVSDSEKSSSENLEIGTPSNLV